MQLRHLYTAVLVIVVMTATASLASLQESTEEPQVASTSAPFAGAKIYFSQEREEAQPLERGPNGISRFAGLLTQQGAEIGTFNWQSGVPDDADLVVIAGPFFDLSSDQVARLWSYLMNENGSLLLLANPPHQMHPNSWIRSQSGISSLMWTDFGIRVYDNAVVNYNPDGGETALPVTVFEAVDFSTHPITEQLEQGVAFFDARSLEIDGVSAEAAPLLFSSGDFYGESMYRDYLDEGTIEFNIDSDTTYGPLVLAAASQHPATGARVVVVGDLEFATNGSGLQTSPPYSNAFIHPDNVRFLLDSVAWLLDREVSAMSFPTPGPTATVTITPTPTIEPTVTPAAGQQG